MRRGIQGCGSDFSFVAFFCPEVGHTHTHVHTVSSYTRFNFLVLSKAQSYFSFSQSRILSLRVGPARPGPAGPGTV